MAEQASVLELASIIQRVFHTVRALWAKASLNLRLLRQASR
jgi:hypothetical protein